MSWIWQRVCSGKLWFLRDSRRQCLLAALPLRLATTTKRLWRVWVPRTNIWVAVAVLLLKFDRWQLWTLQWRHNNCHGVSNHQCLDCLPTVCSEVDQSKHQSCASLVLWGEYTGDRWIARTKGQQCEKYFHLITSSWYRNAWLLTPGPSLLILCRPTLMFSS